jgi:DNA-binding response OmpR family regulator
VLDLQLPAGDGLTVLRSLRKSNATQKTHIVVLTGMTNELFKQSVLTEGVDAYLQKPYDAQVLLDTIDSILNKPADSEKKESPEEPTLFDFAADKNQTGK